MNKRYVSILAILVVAFIAFFSFKTAYSADKPTVSTVSASTQDTKAVLKGIIKESGGRKISSYGFKWGTSREMDENQTFNGSDPENSDFSFTINNLKAGHTYFYQAFASNSEGSAYGEVKSFNIPVKHNQAPNITISNPADKYEVSQGTAVKIAASATDDSKVVAMSLYINDAVKTRVNSDSIEYSWDTSQEIPGDYKLLFTAWDGSKADYHQITVVIKTPDTSNVSHEIQTVVQKPSLSNSNSPSRSGYSGDASKYPLLSKMNGIYGQFRYRNTSGGRIEVDPQWVAANIVTITLPGLNQRVEVHKNAADNFILAFNYIKNGTATINGRQVPLLSLINTMDGTYVTRHVMWDPSRGLSNHSWGTAIDINADDHLRTVNPGSEPNDPNLILWEKAFKPAGFSWGNSFADSMHYELK